MTVSPLPPADADDVEVVTMRYRFALNEVARVASTAVLDGVVSAAARSHHRYEIAKYNHENARRHQRKRTGRALKEAMVAWRTCREVVTYTLAHVLDAHELSHGQIKLKARHLISLRIRQLDQEDQAASVTD
jgi:hypothetical protein